MSNENHQTTVDTALAEAGKLRYLDPGSIRFCRHGATVRLTLARECSYPRVSIYRAFPLSLRSDFISVVDSENNEVGIIERLDDLSANDRRIVEEELVRRYLVPVISRVVSVSERFGTVEWEVETDRGRARFTTKNLRDNLESPSPNRYLLL